MTKKKKRVILIGAAVLVAIMALVIYFIKRPTKIERTMSGVIVDKQTKKQVGTTSVTMDLKRYWKRDGYEFKGKMQFQNLEYTKEKPIVIWYTDKSEDNQILGDVIYSIFKESEEGPDIETKIIQMSVADKDWSGFVVTGFSEGSIQNDKELIVFPAKTEQEALDVINHYSYKDEFYTVPKTN